MRKDKDFCIVTHTHVASRQFFFSTDHMQSLHSEKTKAMYSGFVPATLYLPITVAPRKGVEDGICDSLEKYMLVFERDGIEIENPDPNFIPEFRRKKFVILRGIAEGNRFFSPYEPGSDPRKLANGNIAYDVLGYRDSVEECQEFLFGRSYRSD